MCVIFGFQRRFIRVPSEHKGLLQQFMQDLWADLVFQCQIFKISHYFGFY
jgi:hypothetical protein